MDVYIEMRLRIALRKHGKIPRYVSLVQVLLPLVGLLTSSCSGDDTKDEDKVKAEMAAVKLNKGSAVGRGDIIRAFERGEEVRDSPILSPPPLY